MIKPGLRNTVNLGTALTFALALAPSLAWAATRNFENVCVKGYREQFRCEQGANAAYDREESFRRETRFCEKVGRNDQHYAEKSLRHGTSVVAYWSSSKGQRELEDVRQFCSLQGIDKMRNFFCKAYAPRCAPVLAKVDRRNGACSGGAKDCLEEAKRMQKESLAELERQKKEFQRTRDAAAEALRALLERAASYVDNKATTMRNHPEAASELALDRDALEAAIGAMGQTGGFVAMEAAASRTNDLGLNGLLSLSASARGLQEGSETGIEELAEAGAGLGQLESLTADRSQRMASVSESTITRAEYPTAVPASAALAGVRPLALLSNSLISSAYADEPVAAAEMASAITKAGPAAIAPATAGTGATAAGGAKYPVKAGSSLRELLAKKFREQAEHGKPTEGAAAVLASPEEMVAGEKKSPKAESVAHAQAEAIGPMVGLTPEMIGPGRRLASVNMAGANEEAEAESLFQRVKSAHRRAEEESRI